MLYVDRLIEIDDVGSELVKRLKDKALEYIFVRRSMHWSEITASWRTDFPDESMFLSGYINK